VIDSVREWDLSKHPPKPSKSIEGISPHYAAPQQFNNEFRQTYNPTDFYQLGAVFYELLTDAPLLRDAGGKLCER
jgi:serine/threonine protein kinase